MKRKILLTLFILSVICFLVFFSLHYKLAASILKTFPLIILLLMIRLKNVYNKLIFSGFIFSLAGDIFLSQSIKMFLPGLGCFFISQIFYILAFVKKCKLPAYVWAVLSYLYGTVVFVLLSSYTGKLTIPVLIYIVVIATMLWRSAAGYKISIAFRYAFYGAVFFVVSDTIIGIEQFIQPKFNTSYLSILTYWAAQFLIYRSTVEKK